MDNPEKAVEIPTRPGCMHRADTYYDEEHPYRMENSNQHHAEPPPTQLEKKAFHFFEIGI